MNIANELLDNEALYKKLKIRQLTEPKKSLERIVLEAFVASELTVEFIQWFVINK